MQDDYSAKTRGAKHVIDASFGIAEKHLTELIKNLKAETFTFGDYGAADAGTSLEFVIKLLDYIKSENNQLPIHLNYSDLPENDFNAVSRNVNHAFGKGQSLIGKYDKLSVSMSPTSFYNPVLPPKMLSLGYSATAMHWLPDTPATLSDHVHMTGSKDEEALKLYKNAAKEALLLNMQRRAEEMHSGAIFLLVNFGITKDGRHLGNNGKDIHMFDNFYKIWQTMAEKGKVSSEEVGNMNFPQYYRSEKDYFEAFDSEQLKGLFELVSIDELHTPCPYKQELLANGDKQKFIQEFPSTLQTWSYETFLSGLSKERSLRERQSLVDEFFNYYTAEIAGNPEEHSMDYYHHIVVVKRK